MSFRLLLVAPPVLHGVGWWSNRDAGKPHLESLAAHVRRLCGADVVELDRVDEPDLPGALAHLDTQLTDDVGLVGISCWTSLHYLGTVAVIKHLRATHPTLPIVVGGHHATALPSDFEGLADWVVVGDGEHALRSLCAAPPKRPDETVLLKGAPITLSDDDPMDWTQVGVGEQTVWLTLSRGCPFRCRFCLEPLRGAASSRYSVAHALHIVETVVRSQAPSSVAFADPLFGSNRRWTEQFLAGLEELALPVQFWAETRADLVTAELLALYRRCGFKLDFGLDTGSLVMAEVMEKAAHPERYLRRSAEMLRAADAEALPHGVYLLFNYPGETPETTRATMDWIRTLMPPGGASSGWLSAQSFFHLPGTESFRRMPEYAERFGSRVHHPRWWTLTGDHHRLATATLPHRDWEGQEDAMWGHVRWQRGVNARWSARWTPEVRSFLQTFYGQRG
ncbi:MAG: cobalamin-dependent protein [Deltaproteobacteria bacterium]|nr:cobalamin-dependent protein [Deltaproteobacteria bacterium]